MSQIVITYVHDTCRFKHFMKLKFHINEKTSTAMAKDINHGFLMPINNLLECETIYLSRCNVCNLKIINMDIRRPIKPTQEEIKAFTEKLDNFHESIIGKPTNNESFNVKYTYTVTKVVELDGVDRDRINTLLNDSNVKSINIVKNENGTKSI